MATGPSTPDWERAQSTGGKSPFCTHNAAGWTSRARGAGRTMSGLSRGLLLFRALMRLCLGALLAALLCGLAAVALLAAVDATLPALVQLVLPLRSDAIRLSSADATSSQERRLSAAATPAGRPEQASTPEPFAFLRRTPPAAQNEEQLEELPEALEGVVLETRLAGLNVSKLARELKADLWHESSLLVKVLRQQGVWNLTAMPWVGASRNVTFTLGLGIPWEKIQTWMSHSPAASEKAEDQEDLSAVARNAAESPEKRRVESAASSGPQTDVFGTYKMLVNNQQNVLYLESAHTAEAPFAERLRMRMSLAILQEPGVADNGALLRFSGSVEWVRSCPRIIQRFMEAAFLQAERLHGQLLLRELQSRSEVGAYAEA
eukprot:TRINITY_DN90980_c0_g1_i1.p1 TRINITY_DN90980_c0_g1~~TRINITY_DN90980_c0_g1_i1.p1  ORF type:complete len:376 (+),score=91.01 TRINITY_DN90980_c0_g1_i1:69-1196(+)